MLTFVSCTDDNKSELRIDSKLSERATPFETLCDYNDDALEVLQLNLSNYFNDNEFDENCHEIIDEWNFSVNVASNGIPHFCVDGCEVSFDEICAGEYPNPVMYVSEIIRQMEIRIGFRTNSQTGNPLERCMDGSYFVLSSLSGDVWMIPPPFNCDCEWEEVDGCLTLANPPNPPMDAGCSVPFRITIEGYCVIDKETQCVEIENICGDPIGFDPGDDFMESTCVSPDGNGFCLDLEDGDCIELEQPESCNCKTDKVLDGIDLINMLRVGIHNIDPIFGQPNSDYVQLFGDINCDGGITPLDLVIMQRFILGIDVNPPTCFEIGECVLLNPSVVEDVIEPGQTSMPNMVCSDDFADGPITLVQGVFGDVTGSCCNSSLLQGLESVKFSSVFMIDDGGVYLREDLSIMAINLVLQNEPDIVLTKNDVDILENYELVDLVDYSVLSVILEEQNSVSAESKLMEVNSPGSMKLFESNEAISYVVESSGNVIIITND